MGDQLEEAGTSPGPVKRGLGVAFQSCRHGGITPPMSALIKLDPDGSVELLNGLNDSGGWQKTTMAMIAAEELGIPYDACGRDDRRHRRNHRYRRAWRQPRHRQCRASP